LAAKKQRGSYKDPFTSEKKPYFFDVGIADEMAVCYSCHAGGGVAEGIVNNDGSVIPYNDPSLKPVHTYDRDFYSYPVATNTLALLSNKSIEDTVKSLGDGNGNPVPDNWAKTGVMENDCLVCHTDPESSNTLNCADGLKAQPFRPRLMIFAERDSQGKVTKISLGTPTQRGLKAESVFSYTDAAQRMGRPTKLLTLMQLPKNMVGEMMDMWEKGLKQIEDSGISLPYAIYGQNVSKIWDNSGQIKSDYCANPNGVADEMTKLMGANSAINNLFNGFLAYLKSNKLLPDSATMNDMMGMFFNDFIYAYKIKDQMGNLLPIPVPLRAYEPGKFYTDWDMPQASVRDFMRSPFVEGEGIPYTGMNGLAWGATMYGMQLMMGGDMTYYNNTTGSIDTAKVLADYMAGKIPQNAIQPALHEALPYMFGWMPSARLMGTDPNGDGAPITYVQIIKNGNNWEPKFYYNLDDLNASGIYGYVNFDLFGGYNDKDSWKWVKVCGQCHVEYKDNGNSGWEVVRPFGLGMGADFVKNGRYVNFTNNKEASGYEVHQSSKKMGCGSCHFRDTGSLEDKHNFLKGTDTANMVRNDLDNNPKPKTCEYCHLSGGDSNAPNPTKAHEEKFGDSAIKHLAEIACKTCHVPFRRTWRFRTFSDLFGYYLNFDNGFGYNVLPGGNGKAMAFPGEYRISPVYGTSPMYGLSKMSMLANHIDANGSGVVPMDYVSQMTAYFEMGSEADPGKIVNGMPTNPKFDFMHYFYKLSLEQMKQMGVPINYDPNHDLESEPPLYWANGSNGYPQIVIGNPITIMTWVDLNPEPDHDMSNLPYNGAKVLYIREMNAAVQGFYPRVAMDPTLTPDKLANILPNDKDWAKNPNVAKIILKDSGYVMFDHTGDGFPDLWWPEDVQAMKEALIKVLKAEGETNPDPRVFITAQFYSDSHGVQPKEYALGAKSCYDCHGDYKKNPGAHRITDKEIVFIPWKAPFMDEQYRYSPKNTNGLYVVDKEIAYIKPQTANGMQFIGAKASEVLEGSKHQAEELFYLASEGEVKGTDIENNFGITLSENEKATTYLKQIVNGPWDDKQIFYIPQQLDKNITALGFVPVLQNVHLENGKQVNEYVLKILSSVPSYNYFIIKLPFTGKNPVIYYKGPDDSVYSVSKEAKILDQKEGIYVVVKAIKIGEYIAVDSKDTVQILSITFGWNLKALPVKDNITVEDIFNVDGINTVWKWKVNSWKIWSPNQSIMNLINNYGIGIIAKISTGEGFWVNAGKDVSVEINGSEEYGLEVLNIEPGWNLVGTGKDLTANDFTSLGAVNTVWKWTGNSWQIWSPNSSIMNLISNYGLTTIDKIDAGEGFWVDK
jgi:hypothetical protein